MYCTSKPLTGNRGFGTGTEERALETALRPMGCSSYENYSMSIARSSDGEYLYLVFYIRFGNEYDLNLLTRIKLSDREVEGYRLRVKLF